MSIVSKASGTLFAFSLLTSFSIHASTYSAPPSSNALIGEMRFSSAEPGDSVVTIAERYDLGFNAVKNANPHLDMKQNFPGGASLQIPTQHLLPNQPRKGIVVNLPEMRMYYYPKNTDEVITYPIGIGKIGKTIPIKKAKVTRKKKDPYWIPPQDIREFNLEQGIVLPRIMPPGPDNPLGPYAIYMSIPTYLFHSTIFPNSVGTRASFGCIRMYETDIEDFFPAVKPGIPISIINSPFKAGWEENYLYAEAHEPLEEHEHDYDASLAGMVSIISNQIKEEDTLVDWQLVSYLVKEKDGIPHPIGMRISD